MARPAPAAGASKSEVNEVSLSRTPRNPRRRLRPMAVKVSIVRPRSASVCHHEASRSTSKSRRPWRRTIAGHTCAASAIWFVERSRLTVERSRVDLQRGGEPRPHAPPAEDVAVDDVQRLVRGRRRRRCPHEVVGQQARVGHVGDRFPLLPRAGEPERTSRFPADRGVDGEGHSHVHDVPERPADQRVRPVHRPREAVALGRLEEDVLLHVVEVLVREARLLLGERRVGLGLRVRLERPQVVLETGHQRNVLGPIAPRGRIEEVPEHAAVDLAVLGLRGAP